VAQTSVFILTPDFPAVEGGQIIGGSYDDAIAAAKGMGYDGVEITMGDPDKFNSDAFQASLERHGMKVSAINSGGIEYLFHLALVHEDARKAESAMAILKHNIRHCHRLGCMQQIGVARGFAVPGRPKALGACIVLERRRVKRSVGLMPNSTTWILCNFAPPRPTGFSRATRFS